MKKLLASLLLSLPVSAWSLTVDVYHTSDVHGWYYSRPAKWDKQNSTRTIGGFPALSALVKAGKNPKILLDSGDTYQGTPEGTLTKGLATARLMNQLGYAAAAVGNHDYDYSEESFRAVVAASSFPWLGANIYLKEGGARADYVKPYHVVEVAGKKIAVVGVAGRHTSTSTLPKHVAHLEFRDEAAEAAAFTAEARAKGADAVIVLAHVGIGGSVYGKVDISTLTLPDSQASYGTLAVARASRADVVFGGHNHTGLEKGWRDPVSGSLLAESYFGLTHVSRVALDFDDKTGKLKAATAELVPLWTDETGEDQAVLETLKGFSAEVDRQMGEVVSETAFDLLVSTVGLDSDIGNWFTDAMRRQSGADVAIQNTPGIRADLRKGQVRVRDVFQVMPFENTLVKLKMTGAQLRRLFADNLSGPSSKLQVSGIKVSFRQPVREAGNIVLERNGKPVADSDTLTVATNNYLTTGGSGGKVFSEVEEQEDTMRPIRDLLLDDVRAHPVKELPAGGRLVRLP